MAEKIGSAVEMIKSRPLEENLIIAAIPAMILPDKALAISVLILTAAILLCKGGRAALLRTPAALLTPPLLCVLMLPAVLSGYRDGMLIGFCVWLCLFFGIITTELMTAGLLPDIMDALLLLSGAAAVYGVYCKLAGILEKNRVRSFFENPNHYAYAIELFVLIALCEYLRRKKPVYLIAAAVNLLMNLLCGCRTAWFSIMVGVLIFIMLSVRSRWILPITASVCASAAGVISLMPSTGGRMSQDGISQSFGNRIRYWDNALRWFRERPVIGWGVTSYAFLSERDGEKVLFHAHNMILNILLDTGIIGFAVITAFLAVWLWNIFCSVPSAKCRPYRNLALAVLTATVIHGMTDFTLLGVSPALIFIMTVSCAGCIRRDK